MGSGPWLESSRKVLMGLDYAQIQGGKGGGRGRKASRAGKVGLLSGQGHPRCTTAMFAVCHDFQA